MDDRVVIALFRHGLTVENKRKAYLGWNDSPLCPETKDLSISTRYEYYFSSDLQRCISTVQLLFPNTNPFLIEELREMHFGKWEGKTYDELKADLLYQRWLSDPFHICPPEGESFYRFTKRVQAGWQRIIQEMHSHSIQRCAVMTHGGVIRYLLSELAPEQKDFWSWQTPHDQGLELMFDKDALRRGKRCTLLLEVPLTGKDHG
ncbi:histidine phosphatase family protein [Neobacillus ginsengisoli]|uniref:Alpha-ribazole phosphatase n=1 Tax=Neobacillus ginsengisoli TaxID=904295 RepID=A0ABT9XVN3_9BACI|nr:histidine phosphatase family protein [Neobacillus ginsengisoli]MDQ0199639.1 alpha-ribazole phosphatase [Neobacillus ginsengisoli]